MLLEKLTTAKISWSEEGFPSNCHYQDKYFCLDGIKESQYVFIEGSQLEQQWQHYEDSQFNILETGFGCGLNFILTFELWKNQIDQGNLLTTQLQYFSIENSPISIQDLTKIVTLWPKHSAATHLLLEKLPQPIPGRHLLKFYYKQHCFHLYLLYADIDLALSDLLYESEVSINAFYLDGFSPNKNEKMWSNVVFKQLRLLSARGATLATYTAASTVSKSLQKNHFKVTKIKGFNRKREMITAVLNESHKKIIPETQSNKKMNFAVIGAGLSGCITAAKLAEHGISVSLIEASDTICNGASGNDYGLAYPRLSNGYDNSCLLHLSGINFLQRELQQLQHVDYQFSGLEVLLGTLNPNSRINKDTLNKLNLGLEFVEYENNTKKSIQSLKFKSCGQINPKSLAQSYLNSIPKDAIIDYYFDTLVSSIFQQNNKWKLLGGDKISALNFDGVVVCSGFEHLSSLHHFNNFTKPVQGQIDTFKVTQSQHQKIFPICASRYLIPIDEQQYLVGASYQVDSTFKEYDRRQSEIHKQFLVEQLRLQDHQIQHLSTRVGIRLSSNDRIPIVGSVSEENAFISWYLDKLKYANTQIISPVQQGLYVNIAHGSHGLITIPILSEHLVKMILGQTSPLHHSLQKAIFPQRFLQRKIRRESGS